MLQNLYIKNYLLIEEINLDFKPGFSVITGETGAGKSIILGAISLLTGKRADVEVLQDKNSKCIIEAHFNIKKNKENIKDIFLKLDVDFDDNTIIRREIIPSGKSRAFINDTPVNLSTLKDISKNIINIHSQHENLALNTADYRLDIIDTAAETKDILTEYKEKFYLLNKIKNELDVENKKLIKAKQDIDYYTFQVEQINNANLNNDNELEELENQSTILENAEEIQEVLSNCTNIVDNDNISIESLVRELKTNLNRINRKYNTASQIVQRLDAILIEVRDIKEQLESDVELAETNPELLENVNSRIDLINNLLSKHNVLSISELKEVLHKYESFITDTETIEENIKILEEKYRKTEKECIDLSQKLSKKRESVFKPTESHIISQLNQLGMPEARFEIQNNKHDTLKDTGIDNLDFMFSANKSQKPQIIEKVASGGEFSRLMLCLKSLYVDTTNISTIIFDEIDTGVSGEIASKMGKIMLAISTKTQVISITHLPQVAAISEQHYKVYKITKNNKTQTNIESLNSKSKIDEIASMISGETLTQEAIENAKMLISIGNKTPQN